MISGVITFVAIIICAFIMVAKQLWIPLSVIFIVFLLFSIVRIVRQYHRMGREQFFAVFKGKKVTERRDILVQTLNRFPDYHQIIKMDRSDADYLLLSQTGLYLFRYSDAQGMITEHEKQEYWRVEKDNYRSVMPNEVYFLKRLAKQLEKSLKVPIRPYLVISDFTFLQITFDPDVIIKKERNFIFHFEHHGEKKIYTEKEVDRFVTKVHNYLEKQQKKESSLAEPKTPSKQGTKKSPSKRKPKASVTTKESL